MIVIALNLSFERIQSPSMTGRRGLTTEVEWQLVLPRVDLLSLFATRPLLELEPHALHLSSPVYLSSLPDIILPNHTGKVAQSG